MNSPRTRPGAEFCCAALKSQGCVSSLASFSALALAFLRLNCNFVCSKRAAGLQPLSFA